MFRISQKFIIEFDCIFLNKVFVKVADDVLKSTEKIVQLKKLSLFYIIYFIYLIRHRIEPIFI